MKGGLGTLEENQPNIIFIMSDDHAEQAISCYDSKMIKTPNIDRIAKEGIRFENSFVTNASESMATLGSMSLLPSFSSACNVAVIGASGGIGRALPRLGTGSDELDNFVDTLRQSDSPSSPPTFGRRGPSPPVRCRRTRWSPARRRCAPGRTRGPAFSLLEDLRLETRKGLLTLLSSLSFLVSRLNGQKRPFSD